jgi:TonB-dependent starch-binding outer membrane protein SusC
MREDLVPDPSHCFDAIKLNPLFSSFAKVPKYGFVAAIALLNSTQMLFAAPAERTGTGNHPLTVNSPVPSGKFTEPQVNTQNKQAINVAGKVTDENGQPLPGVTVQVKGSTLATQTDVTGSFSISPANGNQVLAFSMVGYETQEVLINGQTTINVKMKPAVNSLNDVVVVGYGTQKKADVTGSVVRANLDDFRNSPTTNVANLLQGTVPGLNVGQVNRAGATPSINIRGTNTLSGNSNVLIILDGVQYTGSLTSINPDDIASIDVLKDASATAVYGAQAANGVLLITSRKGVAGRTRISLSTQYATQSPNNDLKPMGREEYLDKIRDLFYEQAYLAPGFTQPNPAFNLAAVVDPSMRDAQGNLSTYDYDWYGEGTRRGYIFDNQLSLSGGADKVTYLLSGSLTRNVGFINNDVFRRKSLRSNIETKATDWLTVGLQAFGSFVNEDGVEPGLSTLRSFAPLVRSQDDAGNFIINPYNSNLTNPFLSYQADDYDRHNYFFANIYANVQLPIKGLSYRLTYGNNYRIDQRYTSNRYDANLTGQASKEHTTYYDYTLDNILTYNRTFDKHNIVATLLYGAVERKNDYTRAYATVFDRITLGYNNLEQGLNRFAISNAYREALNYQMARLNYSYDSRYLLTATVRRDGFSGFAQNYKSAIFPSLSVGWDIARESFFKVNWVDNLKLTVGYGVVGNQTRRYTSLPIVDVLPGYQYVFGDGGTTQFGQQVNSLPNPNLRWERTEGINTGLDFVLFKSRLSGRVEYYSTRTTDLLYEVNIPVLTGFARILSNIGQLNNTGVEFSLNSKNISSRNFQWSSALNFARNVNKVVKLLGDTNGDGREDDLPQSGLFIGQPSSVIYDYQTNGIWQLTDQIPAGYSPGTYRIVDQNGDGIINNSGDRTILGAGAPSFRASLLNTFKYGNFTLSVFLNSVYGGDRNYLAANTPRMVRNDNTIRDNYLSGTDFWSPRNPDGKYPRSIVASTISPSFYQNRSFLRLQDVSLSYRFTGKAIERLKLQNVNLFVSGRNLATWTNWEGWDPETDDGNRGLTSDGRPVLRGYSVGLNVTF